MSSRASFLRVGQVNLAGSRVETLSFLRSGADSKLVAYADDLAVTVPANSRESFEASGEQVNELLEKWASGYKLELSTVKTKYMTFGPSLVRPPTVILYATNVQRVEEFKYLDLVLDRNGSFLSHVRKCCENLKAMFLSLRRQLAGTWDLNSSYLIAVYVRAVLPMLGYGYGIWGHRILHSRVVRVLRSCGRLCAIVATRSYTGPKLLEI